MQGYKKPNKKTAAISIISLLTADFCFLFNTGRQKTQKIEIINSKIIRGLPACLLYWSLVGGGGKTETEYEDQKSPRVGGCGGKFEEKTKKLFYAWMVFTWIWSKDDTLEKLS